MRKKRNPVGNGIAQQEAKPKSGKPYEAVCGLFCPACRMYLATQDGPQALKASAERMGRSLSDVTCDGCRSERRSFYCTSLCIMVRCAQQKGIDFCSDCADFPCQELEKFKAERPHRREILQNLNRIRHVGYEQWFGEMVVRYSCHNCGTINSAYDRSCRCCGAVPSCAFVADNPV